MDDKKDILTKVFRKRLENYGAVPDEGLWDQIEKDLQAQTPSKTSKTIPLWKWAASIAAVALIAVSLGIFFTQEKEQPVLSSTSIEQISSPSTEITPVEENKTENLTEKDTYISEEFYTQTEKILSGKQQKEEKINSKNEGTPLLEEKTEKESPDTYIANNDIAENNVSSEKPIQETTVHQKEKAKAKEEKRPLTTGNSNKNLWASSPKKKKDSDRFAMSLAMSNSNSNGNKGAEGTFPLNNYQYILSSEAVKLRDYELIDVEYDMPISVGVYARKFVYDNLAIETGLVYTYLSSKEYYSALSEPRKTNKVQLHYLGIPVKAVYSFFNHDRLSLYVAGGGMVEKSIAGKEITSSKDDEISESLNVKELQWSLSASVGINYRLVDHLGLFIEPGVNYFFDDKSDVKTVRKEHPFNFQLQGGIRFTY